MIQIFCALVVDSLNNNLRDIYENTLYSHHSEWPPDQPKSLVSNTLVYYKNESREQQLLDISTKGASGIDEVSSSHPSRVIKSIASLFKSPKDRFILIEGAPGIGKTVLAKEIAYRWAGDKVLKGKKLFLLVVRDPFLHNVDSINKQLISYFSNNYLSDSEIDVAVDELRKTRGQNIVFVIDGFDECPYNCPLQKFIEKLSEHVILPKALVIITSRPHATYSLQPLADKIIEILGFAKLERDKYISESLKEFPGKKKELERYLKRQPIIKSIMHVPLHIAVLLFLFKNDYMPETLTELNEQFVIHTVYRHLEKQMRLSLPPFCNIRKFKELEKLPGAVVKTVNQLAKLAMWGLEWNKIVFTYDDVKAQINIEPDLNGFGLLQAVLHYNRGAGNNLTFNFLHLTMQEFLAAYYLSTLPSEEQSEIAFCCNDYVMAMFIGIVGVENESFIKYQNNTIELYKMSEASKRYGQFPISPPYSRILFLFQCYLEAKKFAQVPESISTIFKDGNIQFQGDMQPYYMVSLINYIINSTTQCRSLTLKDCKITEEGLNILQDFFTDYEEIVSGIHHVCLSKNDIGQIWETNPELCILSNSGLFLIPHLDLSESMLNDDGIIKLFTTLQCNTYIKQLDVSRNDISSIGVTAISECLNINNTLQELNVSHNKLLDDGVKIICESLKTNNCTLQMLKVADNGITNVGATEIADTIKVNETLLHLNISRNFIDKGGIMAILVASRMTKTLNTLECMLNVLSKSDYLDITDYVRKETTIKKINVSWYWILWDLHMHPSLDTKEFINAVTFYENGHDTDMCLRDGHYAGKTTDPKLIKKIIHCCIRDRSVKQLFLTKTWHFKSINLLEITAEAIQVNKTITHLGIRKHDIGDSESLIICNCLQLNIIKKLDISQNKITNKAMKRIIRVIQCNTTLRKLDISDNEVSVSVMEFIGVCLKNNNTLQELIMADTKMTDKEVEKIANGVHINTTLTVLDISENDLSDAGIKFIVDALRENNKMQKLNVSFNTYVTFLGVLYLGECIKTNRNLLKVGMMQACYKVLPAIAHCLNVSNTLQQIDINCSPWLQKCTDIGLKMFPAAIEGNRSLQRVDITAANIFDDEAVAVSNFLQNNKVLKQFILCHCKMIDKGVRKSIKCSRLKVSTIDAFALSKCEGDLKLLLREFVLYFENYINRFKDQAAITKISKIADSICRNNTLKTLVIMHCGIGDKGAAVISDCMACNASITELDLSHNLITSKGAAIIFTMMRDNKVIQSLNMSNNDICTKQQDSGLTAMSNCLKCNTALQFLCVTVKSISEQACDRLCEAIMDNKGLHTLTFDNFEFLLHFDEKIISAMHYNNTIVKLTLPYPFLYVEHCPLQNEIEKINLKRQRQTICILDVHFTLTDKSMMYVYDD